MSPADSVAMAATTVALPTQPVPCAHCGLDVPAGFVEPNALRQFCCMGCRGAFAILHEHRLERYYDLSDRRDRPVRSTGRAYEEFDHPAFQALHVREEAHGLATIELYLEGVRCASCVWLVERTPLLTTGVARAELNIARAMATITWDPRQTSLSAIARTLDSLGYPPHPFRGLKRELVRRKEDRAALVRIGVAGAIAINVMLVALALYSGASSMEPEYQRLFRWVSLVLVVPALVFPGRVFFTGAWSALRTRTLHMDLPIAIGVGAGFVRGAINTWNDAGPIYFDGLAALIFVLLVGRYLQARGQRVAADSAELLYALSPQTARLVDASGHTTDVPVDALLPGMTLDIRAGETIAADGVVDRGDSAVDVALLTGESRPVGVSVGDAVWAGTLNVSAPIRVRVEQAGESSRVAQILRHVEAAVTRKAPVVLFADRMSGTFVAVVLLLAAGIYAYWSTHDPIQAADNAIALLIVTCPCALAMATPLAIAVATGRAARAGILIKGGEILEQLARPGRLWLDKTGTVTQSRTALVGWTGRDDVRPLVLALEAGSSHPIADGLRRAWQGDYPLLPHVESSAHVAGSGIVGVVDGHDVAVGAPGFILARLSLEQRNVSSFDNDAATPVLVAVDGALAGVAYLGDPIRPDAGEAIAQLLARGWKVGLLSGDAQGVVDAVAGTLRIPANDAIGASTPEGKLAVVRRPAPGPVVMVGDGVNDAAAMAAATVGVGVHGGAEACLATAGVYLTTPGLEPLVRLVEGSARTMSVIRRNMLFALVYNAIGAGLAITGTITPLVAALMMPASSLTVVLSSWRSRTFDAAAP